MKNKEIMVMSVLLLILLALLLVTQVSGQGGTRRITDKITSFLETCTIKVCQWTIVPVITLLVRGLAGLLDWTPRLFCFTTVGCEVTGGVDILRPYFYQILVPIYVMAMLFVAGFWIFKAGSPRGRARARSMLNKLVLGMLAVILAPVIFQAMLDLSDLLAGHFMGTVGTVNVLGIPFDFGGSAFTGISIDKIFNVESAGKAISLCLLTPFVLLALICAYVVALLRWFFVYFYGIMFQFIVFLYSFEVTRPYGRKWLKKAIAWIFLPVVQAIVLSFTVVALNSVYEAPRIIYGPAFSGPLNWLSSLIGAFMAHCIVVGGLGLFVLAPLYMTHLLTWIGMGIYSLGLAFGQVWAITLGNMISGAGPASFITAHAEWTRLRAGEQYRSALWGGSGDGFRIGGSVSQPVYEARSGGESPSTPTTLTERVPSEWHMPSMRDYMVVGPGEKEGALDYERKGELIQEEIEKARGLGGGSIGDVIRYESRKLRACGGPEKTYDKILESERMAVLGKPAMREPPPTVQPSMEAVEVTQTATETARLPYTAGGVSRAVGAQERVILGIKEAHEKKVGGLEKGHNVAINGLNMKHAQRQKARQDNIERLQAQGKMKQAGLAMEKHRVKTEKEMNELEVMRKKHAEELKKENEAYAKRIQEEEKRLAAIVKNEQEIEGESKKQDIKKKQVKQK